ncbi:MAG: DNA primase, partial [Candidatus Pacebacteria bacterium]|nr:DNA primase [Candidatus Paceibacterota bacterium]
MLPFLKTEYFEKKEKQVIFDEIYKFIDQYNTLPSKEAIQIELEKRNDFNEEGWGHTQAVLDSLAAESSDKAWLLDATERYCKDRALHLAVLKGIHIINGDDKTHNTD